MASRKVHCEECLEKLGRDWNEVHQWLDATAGWSWPHESPVPLIGHRTIRHHTQGVEYCRRKWGEQAAAAARLHILKDLEWYGIKHIPTPAEAREIWGPAPHPIKEVP